MDFITNENPVSQTTDDLQSRPLPPRPDTLTQNNVQHISHESIDVTCCYNFFGVCKNVVSCLNTPSCNGFVCAACIKTIVSNDNDNDNEIQLLCDFCNPLAPYETILSINEQLSNQWWKINT